MAFNCPIPPAAYGRPSPGRLGIGDTPREIDTKETFPSGTETDKVFERRRARVDPRLLRVPTPSPDGRWPDTSVGNIGADGDGHSGPGAPPRRPGDTGSRAQLCPTLPLLSRLANATLHRLANEKVHGGSHTPGSPTETAGPRSDTPVRSLAPPATFRRRESTPGRQHRHCTELMAKQHSKD